MLTVDFDRLGLRPGERVLDLGCGGGRHAFEMYRRGADVVAFDQDADELAKVRDLFVAMREAGEVPAGAEADVKEGDALALPFADGEFDRVVAAEILEHVPADLQALAELVRVTRPGGHGRAHGAARGSPRWCAGSCRATTTTPRAATSASTPPRSCCAKARGAGLEHLDTHYAHGLHSPYWWLKCAVGVHNDDNPAVKAYHRLLVWDIMKKPRTTRVRRAAARPGHRQVDGDVLPEAAVGGGADAC